MRSLTFTTCLLTFVTAAAVQADDGSDAKNAGNEAEIEEVRILGTQRSANYTIITENTQMLVETAGALGDPLGAIFSLPGVVSGDQGPAVRGASPDDNIFLVDFMPTGSYIFHLFGMSVFSEHLLHEFQMYPAGFGPEYGGVTGAVFDVTLRQPKNQRLGGVVDVSMLRSGLLLEGGLTKNSAFYLSARRSMLDLFFDPDDLGDDEDNEGIRVRQLPKDTDYQAKYTWEPNDNHRFSITASGASNSAEAELSEEADFVRSNPDFSGEAFIEQRFDGVGALWEYAGDGGTAWKLGVNELKTRDDVFWGDDYSEQVSETENHARGMLSVPLGTSFGLRVGGQYSVSDIIYDRDSILFICSETDPDCDLNRQGRVTEVITPKIIEQFGYADIRWTPTDNLVFDIGVQNQSNDFTEENFVHPRFAARWQVLDSTAITARAGRYNRFPNLDTVLAETGNPDLKSPLANHFTLGWEQNISDSWSFTVEGYYKALKQLPRTVQADEPNPDLRYDNGTEGTAQGLELFVSKQRVGKWWGWLTLSYAKSNRTNLLTQETKEYFLDTPLIFNWVMNYQLRPNLTLGGRWTVRSGQADTPIVGVQESPFFEDSILPVYGDPFSDRLPTYNRLDVRLQWDTTTFGLQSALILDVINALNIQNIESRDLDYDKVNSPEDEPVIVETVAFGILPVITYRLRF